MVDRAAQVDAEELTLKSLQVCRMVMVVSNWSDIDQKGWSNALHPGFINAG